MKVYLLYDVNCVYGSSTLVGVFSDPSRAEEYISSHPYRRDIQRWTTGPVYNDVLINYSLSEREVDFVAEPKAEI